MTTLPTPNTQERHQHDPERPAPQLRPRRPPAAGQGPLDERRAVEGRDRQQVEQRQQHVEEPGEERDLDDAEVADAVAAEVDAVDAAEGPHDQGGDDGDGEVRGRAGEGDDDGVVAGPAQPAQVDRDGLGVADDAEARRRQQRPAAAACRTGRRGRSG